jgi:manganese/zinc/iron transport system ATP- binding protein
MNNSETENKDSIKNITVKIDDLTIAYNYKPVLWDNYLDIPKGILIANIVIVNALKLIK